MKLLPEEIDNILGGIGYRITSETINIAGFNEIITSDISATGYDNCMLDHDKIIEYLSANGISVLKLELSSNRDIFRKKTLGSLQYEMLFGDTTIELEMTCVTDSIMNKVTVEAADLKEEPFGFKGAL